MERRYVFGNVVLVEVREDYTYRIEDLNGKRHGYLTAERVMYASTLGDQYRQSQGAPTLRVIA